MSEQCPCLIFKHSTRCSISSTAKNRLESKWQLAPPTLTPFYLDLLQNRELSNYIAQKFNITHESPQILLIINGECVYSESHLNINLPDIANQINNYETHLVLNATDKT